MKEIQAEPSKFMDSGFLCVIENIESMLMAVIE